LFRKSGGAEWPAVGRGEKDPLLLAVSLKNDKGQMTIGLNRYKI